MCVYGVHVANASVRYKRVDPSSRGWAGWGGLTQLGLGLRLGRPVIWSYLAVWISVGIRLNRH